MYSVSADNSPVVINKMKRPTRLSDLTPKIKRRTLRSSDLDLETGKFLHDLRNVLNIASCNIQLLAPMSSQELTSNKLVNNINFAITRMVELVDDYGRNVEQSPVQTRVFVDDEKTFDPHIVVSECVDALSLDMEDKNINIKWLALSEMVEVKGNRGEINRVIMNVLSNAIKYNNNNGDICICETIEHERNLYLVDVIDNGIGIHQKNLNKIFIPKQRFSPSTKGQGYGMSIARENIEKNGGLINVRSDGLGKGTSVRISIPLSTFEK